MLSATPELFHRELFDLLWLPFRMIACQFACKCLVHIKLPVAINSHALAAVSVIRGNVDYSCKLVKCFWCVLFMDDLWMSKSKNFKFSIWSKLYINLLSPKVKRFVLWVLEDRWTNRYLLKYTIKCKLNSQDCRTGINVFLRNVCLGSKRRPQASLRSLTTVRHQKFILLKHHDVIVNFLSPLIQYL